MEADEQCQFCEAPAEQQGPIHGRIAYRCPRCHRWWLAGDDYVVKQRDSSDQYMLGMFDLRARRLNR